MCYLFVTIVFVTTRLCAPKRIFLNVFIILAAVTSLDSSTSCKFPAFLRRPGEDLGNGGHGQQHKDDLRPQHQWITEVRYNDIGTGVLSELDIFVHDDLITASVRFHYHAHSHHIFLIVFNHCSCWCFAKWCYTLTLFLKIKMRTIHLQ